MSDNNDIIMPVTSVFDENVVVFNYPGSALWRGTKLDNGKSLIEFYDGTQWIDIAEVSQDGGDFRSITLITSVSIMNGLHILDAAEYVDEYLASDNTQKSTSLH